MSWSGTVELPVVAGKNKKNINPDDILDDFIDRFVEFYTEMNEVVPDEYIRACAIFCIPAAVGGSLVMRELEAGEKKMNVFILLLGTSSISHKTVPVTNTENFLKEFNLTEFLSARFSVEGSIMELRAKPYSVLIRDEFTGLMAEATKNYIADLKEFLLQLYDNNLGSRTTIKYGKVDVSNTCVSLLSATVPDALSARLVPEDISGGCIPRFVMICAEPKKHTDIGIKRMQKKDMSFKFKLGRTLEFIQSKFTPGTTTEARFTDESYEMFNGWIKRNNIDADEAKSMIQPFFIRLGDYLIKLCMIYQLSDTKTEVHVETHDGKIDRYILIEKRAAERAIAWVSEYKSKYLPRALAMLSNVETERIFNVIKELCSKNKAKEIRYSEVLHATSYRHLTRDLMQYITTLEDADRISTRKTLRDVCNIKKPTLWIKVVVKNESN